MTQALSWRWFFFVNIPVAILAIVLTLVAVRESKDEDASRHVDLFGVLTITGGLAALVLAIQQGDTLGWVSLLVIGSMLAALVLLGLFFFVEPRLPEPLIDLGLFANRSYVGANAVAFAQNFGFAALLFFLTLYLQNILHYSPLQAGLMFLAFSAILAVVDSFAGRLAASVGARPPMVVGMALCAVAFLLLVMLSPTSGLPLVIVAVLVAGVGQALAYTVSTTGGMQAIPEAKAGAASGILSMIRFVGAVFGVAVTLGSLRNDRAVDMHDAGYRLRRTPQPVEKPIRARFCSRFGARIRRICSVLAAFWGILGPPTWPTTTFSTG